MVTPKKKHLIELMIEAGVKWPEGAEYAAQDKTTNDLCFYGSKPVLRARFQDEWRPSRHHPPKYTSSKVTLLLLSPNGGIWKVQISW